MIAEGKEYCCMCYPHLFEDGGQIFDETFNSYCDDCDCITFHGVVDGGSCE